MYSPQRKQIVTAHRPLVNRRKMRYRTVSGSAQPNSTQEVLPEQFTHANSLCSSVTRTHAPTGSDELESRVVPMSHDHATDICHSDLKTHSGTVEPEIVCRACLMSASLEMGTSQRSELVLI